MPPPIANAETDFVAGGATAAVLERPAASRPAPAVTLPAADESLFEHYAWLYAFFRDRVFRDDTDRIITALWPNGQPAAGTRLIELGCGPGFYSCGLATRFPSLSVHGVDQSVRQLDCAKTKARRLGLLNCRFEADDVRDVTHADASFDVAIAARLFTVLPDPERALMEMHRILRPGGRCLIAEPRYAFWASLPLFAMWVLASLTRLNNGFREPSKAIVLEPQAFRRLFASQPWSRVRTWQDGRYQYALCEKD
jgi:ubiquinone/menaquinone biosynthesis C-methylase UbiE